MIHVFSDARPEHGFEPVAPDLEDVYFQRLRQHSHKPPERRPDMILEFFRFELREQLRSPLLWLLALLFALLGFGAGRERCGADRRRHRQRLPQCADR